MHANVCIHAQNITCPCGRIISYPRALIMGMASRRFAPLSLSISLSFSLLSIESYISRNFSNYVCMRRRRCLLVQMPSKPNAIRNSSARTRNHIARMQIECTHSRTHTHTHAQGMRVRKGLIYSVYTKTPWSRFHHQRHPQPHTHSCRGARVCSRSRQAAWRKSIFTCDSVCSFPHTPARIRTQVLAAARLQRPNVVLCPLHFTCISVER